MKQHTRTLNGNCPACVEAGSTKPGLGCLMAGSHVRGGGKTISSVRGMEALNAEITGTEARDEQVRNNLAEALHDLDYPVSPERDEHISKLCELVVASLRRPR